MDFTDTESRVPELLSLYVDSRRGELGLPPAERLPFVVAPNVAGADTPRVSFVTTGWGSGHPREMDLAIAVELQVSASNQNGPLESVWLKALRRALADRLAFLVWLAAQDAAVTAGLTVRKMRITGGGMAQDDAKQVRGRRTELQILVISAEMAPGV